MAQTAQKVTQRLQKEEDENVYMNRFSKSSVANKNRIFVTFWERNAHENEAVSTANLNTQSNTKFEFFSSLFCFCVTLFAKWPVSLAKMGCLIIHSASLMSLNF